MSSELFEKFIVLDIFKGKSLEEQKNVILLNLKHVVSIKPVEREKTVEYIVNTSNGKKYRAIDIPESVKNKI